MELQKATVTKIDDTTYRFTESFVGIDVYMYLLVGKSRALLIDTGYGFTDIKGAIGEITSLPLTVVNTHAHFDHIHGNHFFDEALISKKDEECYGWHTNNEYIIQLIKSSTNVTDISDEIRLALHSFPSKYGFLPEEGYFELGDRRVTIIETPGHTRGSICLLDEKNKWCFSGDTNCPDGVLLMFPESTSVETYLDTIQSLKRHVLEGHIELFYPAHQTAPIAPDILERYIEGCLRLLSGEIPEEVVKCGLINAETTTIAFDPLRIYSTAEAGRTKGAFTGTDAENQGTLTKV